MQIQYIWISEYKNIKEQGFNLSSKYIFDYDKDSEELKITLNSEYIEGLFGKRISDIKGVVGENGTGKSNLLDLANIAFFITENNNVFQLNKEKEINVKIIESPVDVEVVSNIKHDDTLVAKYSNYFDGYKREVFKNNLNVFDLSTDKLLTGNYFVNPHNEIKPIEKYRLYETFIQSEFLFAYKDINLPFKTPEKIIISLHLEDDFKEITETINKLRESSSKYTIHELNILERVSSNFIDEIYKIHNDNLRIDNKKKLQKMTIAQLYWAVILNFINTYPADTEGSCLHIFHEIQWQRKKIHEWIFSFFEQIKKEYESEGFFRGDKYYKEYINWSKNIVPFLNDIGNSIDKTKGLSIIYTDQLLLNHKQWPSSSNTPLKVQLELDLTTSESYNVFHKSFYENYKKIIWGGRIDSMGFLYFEWRNMSSGEKKLLSLFSRINSLNLNINAINLNRSISEPKIKNIILLLDEPDIGMHPNWQRTLINKITKTIPIILKKIESVQIIIATHSPFIVSDLPISNLIFLEKDSKDKCIIVKNPLQDKKPTFASNIHTLFTDSFFMRDGLIGEFAKDKINEVIDDLMSSNQISELRKDQIKKIMNSVGEPIVRKKLIQLFEDKYKLTIDDEIANLRKRIENLEKRKNDPNKK